MIHLAILYEIENMVIQLIGVVDIPFIQGPMHVHGPVGYPSTVHANENMWGFFVSGALIMMST